MVPKEANPPTLQNLERTTSHAKHAFDAEEAAGRLERGCGVTRNDWPHLHGFANFWCFVKKMHVFFFNIVVF